MTKWRTLGSNFHSVHFSQNFIPFFIFFLSILLSPGETLHHHCLDYTGFKQNGIRLIIQTCRSRLGNDSSSFVNGNWRHHCVTAIDTDFQRFSWFRTFFFSYTSSFNQKIKQLNSGDKYCELQHFVLFFISGAPREKRASWAPWVNKSTHPKLNWEFLKTINTQYICFREWKLLSLQMFYRIIFLCWLLVVSKV